VDELNRPEYRKMLDEETGELIDVPVGKTSKTIRTVNSYFNPGSAEVRGQGEKTGPCAVRGPGGICHFLH